MAADIDARSIAAFASIPETTVTTLLDQPTKDIVKAFLEAIQTKAKDYDISKSQKVKLEVELETYIRTSESKTKVLQNSRDKALEDVSKLRVELQSAETARSRTEFDLEQIKQSSSSEATQVSNLESRILSLEASNRDTLSLLDSKSSAYDRLSQELSAQHSKVVELRKQVSSLEQSEQSSSSALASAKFREQSLDQELNLQKKNNEWLENERKIKAEEHSHFRKEKNARISELTRLNEQYIEEVESLKRSDSAFKTRLNEQINKCEELLQETQRLREKESADADMFRIELESVNRLAKLQQASADTAKERVEALQLTIEEVREDAGIEIGNIRAEIEAEHHERELAEQEVIALEARIENLESELQQARAQPATPRREGNANGLSTPLRPSTPSGIFSPSLSGRLKGSNGNITVSQIYGEYKNLERDLANEKRLNSELQSNMDAMLEDLETNKPEIEELREDQTRLQSEVYEMSTLVETANNERDTAIKQARLLQGQLDATSKELGDYQQTVRDRNSQLRWMLMDKEARDQGGSLSEVEFQELQRAAAEADARDSEHLSETQRIVNQQLILFKSVSELQQQNENQLMTIRNLVAQLESTEAKETQKLNMKLKDELESANTKIADYQAEIKHMVAQSQSFVKERDMFKNMLTRRGHLTGQVDPADFSRSLPLPAGGPQIHNIEGNTSAASMDYAQLLKDLQSTFDKYRDETKTDNATLRNQINEMSKRSSQLQTDSSRVAGQLAAANQRYEMLQANFNMLKNENAELQKRSQTLLETSTKQELKTTQVAEELIEAKGLLDSLRRESSNLKAEKDLWKSVEKRLIEDNESLRNERGRLEQLNSSIQNMMNEREHADSDTRRRLQSQVEALESELTSTKRKLNEELEDSKKSSLRREYEHEQSQKRIDDLVTSLSNAREELATVKTSKDHLQAKVDELTVELRSAEERLEVLTRPAIDADKEMNGANEDALSHEQELSVEISELKRDLDLKTTELERANEQIEVYKNIAQSAEERLQELTETNDQFKEETEVMLAEKDTKIKGYEQRLEDISAELNTTNSELIALRDEQSESNRKLDEQRTTFETEITRLKEAEERSLEQAQFNLAASKAQAEIATEAQQNYENELVKHAEAAKSLNIARNEGNQLKLEIVELKTQTGTARNDLEQKEQSWSELKDRYERELSDLKKRRGEITQQNNLLHGQLETLTQQVTALQRDRAALNETENSDGSEGSKKDRSEMQEVIKYLRREKEIVDVQYHLLTQDAKRIRQQLELAQSQLDETRLKLDQQRRQDADFERNAMSHTKLMDTLNELNLFRESSVTLRAEAKQANQALSEKSSRIEDLEAQIQPLQAKISEIENLSELREGEMKLLQDDRDHWQQRCQNILSKYDRVDPAELESLKSSLQELEKERDEATSSKAELQAQIDAHPDQIEAAKTDLRNRLAEQFKGRSQQMKGKIKEKQDEVDVVTAEKDSLQTELESVKEQLQIAIDAGASTTTTTSKAGEEPARPNTESITQINELQNKISDLETKLVEKDQQLQSANSDATHEEKFKAREAQLKDVLNKRLAEVKQQLTTAKDTALEELRQQLDSEHQKELEALRASAPPAETTTQPSTTSTNTETSDQPSTVSFEVFMQSITEAQAKQLVQKNETVNRLVKQNIRKRIDEEKEALRKEFASQTANNAEGATTTNEEIEQRFEAQREALVKEKEQEFATEKEAMVKEFDEKLEAERQSLIAQKDEELASERLEFSKESERKIAEQVANAQALAEKRATVKLNMAQNQARVANAKLEVVSKAAEDTPEKAVKEVWEVAKTAKPAPQQAKPQVPPSPTPQKAVSSVSSSVQPTVAAVSTSTTETATVETNGTSDVTTEEKSETAPAVSAEAAKPVQASATPVANQTRSQIPQTRGAHRGGRGGIPVPAQHQQQGQHGRTSGIPRGGARGRGGGRGGTGISTAAGTARGGSSAGSPARAGALNPNAQQFTPGGTNKRARDDGDSGGDGNQGKRIRGGGQGGA